MTDDAVDFTAQANNDTDGKKEPVSYDTLFGSFKKKTVRHETQFENQGLESFAMVNEADVSLSKGIASVTNQSSSLVLGQQDVRTNGGNSGPPDIEVRTTHAQQKERPVTDHHEPAPGVSEAKVTVATADLRQVKPVIVVNAANVNINADARISTTDPPLFYPNNRTKSQMCFDGYPDAFTLVFFLINFLFLCLGIAMVALGAYYSFEKSDLSTLLNYNLSGSLIHDSMGVVQIAMLILMICGFMILILSIMGLCGVLGRSTVLLYGYCFIIVLMLIVKIAIVGLAFYFQESLSGKIQGPLLEALQKNYDGKLNSTNTISRAFDYAQVLLGCCGVTSYKDFQQTKWIMDHPQKRIGKNVQKAFPLTCCQLKDKVLFLKNPITYNLSTGLDDPKCPNRVASGDNEFSGTSCDRKVKQLLVDRASYIYCIGLVVVCLEFIGIAFANGIINDINNKQDESSS